MTDSPIYTAREALEAAAETADLGTLDPRPEFNPRGLAQYPGDRIRALAACIVEPSGEPGRGARRLETEIRLSFEDDYLWLNILITGERVKLAKWRGYWSSYDRLAKWIPEVLSPLSPQNLEDPTT